MLEAEAAGLVAQHRPLELVGQHRLLVLHSRVCLALLYFTRVFRSETR